MKIFRFSAVVCTGLIAISSLRCGAGEASDVWGGTVSDSAGITIVQNPTEGLWAPEEQWTVREDLRIGTATGAPEYQFGMIWDVAVAGGGRIYVLDSQAQHVSVFDADGEFLKTIGRPGDGPGELGPNLRWLMIGSGDTLYVPNTNLQRVQRYLPDGTPTGSFRTPVAQGVAFKWSIGPNGNLVSQLRSFAMPGTDAAPDASDVLLSRTGDGTIVDTLLVLPRGETMNLSGGLNFNFFAPEPVWSIGGDGSIVSAVNSSYRIEVHSRDGGLARIISKAFERQPVTESDRETLRAMILDMFEQQFRDQGLPPAIMDRISVEFADFFPAFNDIRTGPDGTIWVQHIASMERMRAQAEAGTLNVRDLGAPTWDVFNPDGRYLGVVTLPDRFQPSAMTSDHIYGIWRDDLEVQYVLRLELVRPVGPEPT